MASNFEGIVLNTNVPLSGATSVVSQAITGGTSFGDSFFLNNGASEVKFYLTAPEESATMMIWIQTRTGSSWETNLTLDTGVAPTNF